MRGYRKVQSTEILDFLVFQQTLIKFYFRGLNWNNCVFIPNHAKELHAIALKAVEDLLLIAT